MTNTEQIFPVEPKDFTERHISDPEFLFVTSSDQPVPNDYYVPRLATAVRFWDKIAADSNFNTAVHNI